MVGVALAYLGCLLIYWVIADFWANPVYLRSYPFGGCDCAIKSLHWYLVSGVPIGKAASIALMYY